jgi:hypothetical protein
LAIAPFLAVLLASRFLLSVMKELVGGELSAEMTFSLLFLPNRRESRVLA